MQKKRAQAGLTYHVSVTRQDEARARAETRGHLMALNIQKGSGEAGFNAAETLLSALGACLLTNVNALSKKMHLQINAARMEIDAERRDEPPALTAIRYRLVLDSPEPADKLQELHEICVKWGTVTNTLLNGIVPQGQLVLSPDRKEGV